MRLPVGLPTVGEGVSGWEPGQRVLSYGQVTCGECRPCREGFEYRCRRPQVMGMTRQGGFAEKIAVPAGCLVPVPDAVTDEIAAIVPDAIATPYHALITIGQIRAGEISRHHWIRRAWPPGGSAGPPAGGRKDRGRRSL